MAHLSFWKKLTAPGSYLNETFLDDSDGCARGRRSILLGTLSAGMITTLTAGIYFTSLMLAMGASENYIGYVTAFTSLSGIFQLFAPLILEKLPRRKGLLLSAKILYYILDIAVIGIIPLLPIHETLRLVLFMATVIIMHAVNYLATPGISAWQMQSLPMSKRVNFYTLSNIGTMILNQATAFLAGVVLDTFEGNGLSWGRFSPTLTAILLLRVAALVIAAMECRSHAKVREFPYDTDPAGKLGWRLLFAPLKDKLFMRTILIPVGFSFTCGIVGQYFSIYLLEDVKLSYFVIALGGFLSTPLTVLATPVWYKAVRKIVWPKILALAQLGNMIAYALNAFITPNTKAVYFICIFIGSAFAACINIVHSNLVYLHMPTANRTSYFSFYSIAMLLASFLGVNTGILFISATNTLQLSILGFQMGNKQYINLVSASLFLVLAACTFSYSRKADHNITIR